MKSFVILTLFSSAVLGAKLPEGTKTCHKSDPKFNECILDAMTDGIKRFGGGYKPMGIAVTDPVEITELSADTGGFSQKYTNVKISGASDTTFLKLDVNWDTLEFYVETLTPHSLLTADYRLNGKLLSFPIDSSGKCKIYMDDVLSKHNIKMERYQKKGKTHLRAVVWKLKNIPKAIRYDYDSIVPGNEQLSDTIMKTINDNALQIFEELGTPFAEAYGEVHRSVANKVFEKIPEDEIFLP